MQHRVVVIGSGFGGLFATKALRKAPVEVTLLDRWNHHLFQPLLYQVATGILSEGEIAPATREILRHQKNATTLLGEVVDIDLQERIVTSRVLDETKTTPYDSLIVAAGAGQSYFGMDHFAEFAPGMKSIDDALELRGRIFGAFELAEREDDPDRLEEWLTFVVVGGGATGVEMAGQIAELSRRTLKGNFRRIHPEKSRIVLVDAGPDVLSAFDPALRKAALSQLQRMGVEVMLSQKVVDVDNTGIAIMAEDGTTQRLPARVKMWAAGVSASPLAKMIAERSGGEVDRAGRLKVTENLSVPGFPEVFVVGDMALPPEPLPGVAQVAMQGGTYAARRITGRLQENLDPKPFVYKDKGSMATISRFHAVAETSGMRFRGFVAWLLWLGVHLVYLVGFKNRFTTLLHWAVSFVGRGRSQRIGTHQQVTARTTIARLERREREREEVNSSAVLQP